MSNTSAFGGNCPILAYLNLKEINVLGNLSFNKSMVAPQVCHGN